MTTDTATAPLTLLLDSRTAAKALSISERTLWQLSKDGEIPRVKIGRSVRYDRRDLIAFIDGRKGARRCSE